MSKLDGRYSHRISPRQARFIAALKVSGDGVKAAEEAGYKNPKQAWHRLRDPEQNPLVAPQIEMALRMLIERTTLNAENVRRILWDALTVCIGDYFAPGNGNGKWITTEEIWKDIPKHVKALVESCDIREMKAADGSIVRTVHVRMVSKTVALGLAAKYTLEQKIAVAAQALSPDFFNELAAQAAAKRTSVKDKLIHMQSLLPAPKQGSESVTIDAVIDKGERNGKH